MTSYVRWSYSSRYSIREVYEYECSTSEPRGCVEKNLPLPIEQGAGWASQLSRTFWRKEILEVPGIELRFLGRPVRNLVITD
jgi:hypothetical protein